MRFILDVSILFIACVVVLLGYILKLTFVLIAKLLFATLVAAWIIFFALGVAFIIWVIKQVLGGKAVRG